MGVIQTTQRVSWEQDYEHRVHPELMTRLARKAVPVLDWTKWEITEVGLGYCETLLPLSVESTNQHGTHQAAIISLSADYTGGMALTTLLTGVPLSGIHGRNPDESASLWLVGMDVKYERPSTSHLRGTCTIDTKTAERIQKRYFAGKIVLAMLTVEFWSEDGDRVAVGKMRYFAQATKLLLASQNGEQSSLAKLNLKTSARIIAGLRAMTGETKPGVEPGSLIRIDRPHDRVAASTHGMLQANRLRAVLPQLATLVGARTEHGDRFIRAAQNGTEQGIEQIVFLGAGLDMRSFRMADQLRNVFIFELDLPVMLEERLHVEERLEAIHPEIAGSRPMRHQVPVNFLTDDVGEVLGSHPSFSQTAKTLVIYEGCSMYFDEQQNAKLLFSIRRQLKHPESRLWMDYVTPSVIDASINDPNVHEFTERMALIGEKFIYGPADPECFLRNCGFKLMESVTAGDFLKDDDPTLQEYRFLVAGREVAWLDD
ncbi:MAG: SAM-dependent methyltransferase [Planctomycetota bacterium]